MEFLLIISLFCFSTLLAFLMLCVFDFVTKAPSKLEVIVTNDEEVSTGPKIWYIEEEEYEN